VLVDVVDVEVEVVVEVDVVDVEVEVVVEVDVVDVEVEVVVTGVDLAIIFPGAVCWKPVMSSV
jgi:hypothetical protein